jgi:hypothetical protein
MKKIHILTLTAGVSIALCGTLAYAGWSWLEETFNKAVDAAKTAVEKTGEGLKTAAEKTKEGIETAAEKTGVSDVLRKLKITDAAYFIAEQAKTAYEKGVKPAFVIVNKAGQAATQFVLKSGEATIDAIDLVTSDGKCPDAQIQCYVGQGNKTSSCGQLKSERYFNFLQGGCQIRPQDIQNSCKLQCETMLSDDTHKVTFKPEDISFTVLDEKRVRIADFFTELLSGKNCNDKEKVECAIGYGKSREVCGLAEVDRKYASVGKGCVVAVDQIKQKCDKVCQDHFNDKSITSNA